MNALATIRGRAATTGSEGAPIVVVAYRSPGDDIVDLFVLPRHGEFYFALPAGTYRVAAFEDRNRDLVYQADSEPAAFHGEPTDLALAPGEHRDGIDLIIDLAAEARIPFAVSAIDPGSRELAELPDVHVGTIVTLDDPRFSHENGKIGLWQPVQFLFEIGAGVYFLEPYDPAKIPVLFVHGATGHPAEWKSLVGALDRSRFQPWLAYYPAAPRLDRVALFLLRALGTLQAKHDFSRIILVAHSMGGLVARAAINEATVELQGPRSVRLEAFITLSTPWNGHESAAKGVEQAPVVAPSWYDMAPGSDFLAALPERPLPPECAYSLFFSYRGASLFGQANDGVVTLSSQLAPAFQRQATRVMGFDETHTGILRSARVAAELAALLEQVPP